MTKVNVDSLKPWIAQRLTELLGMEDDVVVEFVYNQLEERVGLCHLTVIYPICSLLACSLLNTFYGVSEKCKLIEHEFLSRYIVQSQLYQQCFRFCLFHKKN